jgi:hypothetical protein
LRLIDRKRTPKSIAFCDTEPRVRRNFFAIAGADILAFAMLRSIFTSVFDHARMTRRFDFFFAMDISGHKPRIIPERIIHNQEEGPKITSKARL